MVHRLVRHLTDGDGDFSSFFAIILDVFPREIVVDGRTKSADKNKAEQSRGCYFKRDVSNPVSSVFSYSATARPARPAHLVHESSRARPARSSELAQLRSAFDSDRYQNRQMVERSQINPFFGTFT